MRRWFLIAGGIFGLLIAAVFGVYGWAWSSTDESTIARAMIWRESDVGDQHRFPARRIATGSRASALPAGVEADLVVSGEGKGLDELLRETDTLAFVVVHEDRVVQERYLGGATRESLQTSFSVAKSFASTLVGIAIDRGLIGSVDDPVTKYLPELAARDRRFRQITLRHLVTMSSGIRYSEEAGFPWPFGDDTYTYYGVDLRDVALNRTRIVAPPGLGWQYNNFHPLLLGLVLERIAGTSVSEFMARRLWQPLGAEADATWNLDSERSGFEKMESGLNARPVDYARFGAALSPQRRVERQADHLGGLGPRGNRRRRADRSGLLLRLQVLLVAGCGAARALLCNGEVRPVHLRSTRRGHGGRPLRSHLGSQQ